MARQAGMTLIELTVVLLVLIGLAGLLMPYVGGFVTKTHDSTGASNLSAVNRAIMQYEASYQQFPDRLDSLTNATDGVYTKLMGPKCLAPVQLSVAQAGAFGMAGLDSIMQMDSATTDATFAATNGTELPVSMMTAAADQPFVATLTHLMGCNAAAGPSMAISNTNLKGVITRKPDVDMFDYVVFGVGSDSSLVGKTIATAPVHFAQQGAMGPKSKYNRFGVVFEVPNATVLAQGGYCAGSLDTLGASADVAAITEALCADPDADGSLTLLEEAGVWTESAAARAKFAGSIMLMPMIEGQEAALQNHYDKAAEG